MYVVPSTAVLDAFNRANNASPGANWTTVWGGSNPQIASNQLKVSGASAFNAIRWNPSSFGADSEVFCTLGTFPSTATLGLYCRSDNSANTYEADIVTTGITVKKTVATVQSTLGSNATAFAGGDKVLFRCFGPLLQVFKCPSGGVFDLSTPAIEFSDTDVTAGGSIALFMFDTGTTFTIDDFGGGTTIQIPEISIPNRVPLSLAA